MTCECIHLLSAILGALIEAGPTIRSFHEHDVLPWRSLPLTVRAALAKAQAEFTNPERALVGTIRSPFPWEADRSFRYASLASGLDIAHKVLGMHEIAIAQTTAIGSEAGFIRLITLLAHTSEEWMSSVSRDRNAAQNRRGADLCAAVCPVYAGRHCWRGRS